MLWVAAIALATLLDVPVARLVDRAKPFEARATTAVVSAGGIHVNAYFGDVSGNGTIDGLDVATAATVAQGTWKPARW